ncbi:MAG: FkbM family methyltransferase [Candidatus Babeliaceae bacterium]
MIRIRLIVLLNIGLLIQNMNAGYKSQIGQDKFLNEYVFNNKKKGVFIDIGAHDGITYSNTYFFEKELGWTGICLEPLPKEFEKLRKNRDCICIDACIAAHEGTVPFMLIDDVLEDYGNMLSGMVHTYDERHFKRLLNELKEKGGNIHIVDMPAYRLDTILYKYGFFNIDYISLDTEGSEFEILQTIDFQRFHIKALTVENNYADPRIRTFLKEQGFTFIVYLCNQDEIYINHNF